MKLPFWIWPGHWGLTGYVRELAELEYYIPNGYKKDKELINLKYKYLSNTTENNLAKKHELLELEMSKNLIVYEFYEYQKLELNYSILGLDTPEYQRERLLLDLKYKRITQIDYDKEIIKFLPESEKRLATLQYLMKYHEITQVEYEKEIATLNSKPYFHFTIEYVNGDIELDPVFNENFIEYLKGYGYNGETNDDIIEWYIRDCGRRISSDDIEDYQEENTLSFVKSERTSSGTSYS